MAMHEIKAWKIEDGTPIPDWLEKCEGGKCTAAADLIVTEDMVGGYEVRLAAPTSEASMMLVVGDTPETHVDVMGGGADVNLVTAAALHQSLASWKSRALSAEARLAELEPETELEEDQT